MLMPREHASSVWIACRGMGATVPLGADADAVRADRLKFIDHALRVVEKAHDSPRCFLGELDDEGLDRMRDWLKRRRDQLVS